MSHPIPGHQHHEWILGNQTDWMAGKQTDLDIWLEERGLDIFAVMEDAEGLYVIINKKKVRIPVDFTEYEEDYQFEEK